MRRNKAILAGMLVAGTLLGGCASTTTNDKPLFTMNGTVHHQSEVDKLTKINNTSNVAEALISKELYSKEFKKEWEKEKKEYIEKTTKELKAQEKEYQATLYRQGYDNMDQYIKENMEAMATKNILVKHHFEENKDLIKEFTPLKMKIATVGSEDDGKKVIKMLKDGKSLEDACKEIDKNIEVNESYAYQGSGLIDDTALKTAYNSKDTDIPFSPVKTTGTVYKVYQITSRKVTNDLKDTLINAFLNNEAKMKDWLKSLAKKYDLKIHDEMIYNYLKEDKTYLLWGVKEEAKEENTETEKENQ